MVAVTGCRSPAFTIIPLLSKGGLIMGTRPYYQQNCEDKCKRTSAFRAVNSTAPQNAPANEPIFPIHYPNEIFDLNREYNPETSTFTPKKDGVYLIIASVAFMPNDPTKSYRVIINIRVNELPVVTDNAFFGPNPPATGDESSVSAILLLKAGQRVAISVFIQSTDDTDGIIMNDSRGTHFEAARLF